MEAMVESGSPVAARSKSVLTPSDNMARRAARNSRVHFDEDGYIPQLQEANPIGIQVTGEERSKTIGIYLGFLQEEHKYEVKFSIPLDMCEGYIGPPQSPPLTKEQQGSSPSNLHVMEKGEVCEVTEMRWDLRGKPPSVQMQMEVTVPSTNLVHVLEDRFCIRSDVVQDRFIRINVSGKVMGKSMGTPSLKDGVKCIGLCPDPANENSTDSSDNDNEDVDAEMKDETKNSNNGNQADSCSSSQTLTATSDYLLK